jgi:hypothetical protein
VTLDRDRASIGWENGNDVFGRRSPGHLLSGRRRALLVRLAGPDLGSSHGIRVNGSLQTCEQVLHPGDDILVGTRLVLRARTTRRIEATVPGTDQSPVRTRREHDVLVGRDLPTASLGPSPQPAIASDIASALFVSEARVKLHLATPFQELKIDEPGAPCSSPAGRSRSTARAGCGAAGRTTGHRARCLTSIGDLDGNRRTRVLPHHAP